MIYIEVNKIYTYSSVATALAWILHNLWAFPKDSGIKNMAILLKLLGKIVNIFFKIIRNMNLCIILDKHELLSNQSWFFILDKQTFLINSIKQLLQLKFPKFIFDMNFGLILVTDELYLQRNFIRKKPKLMSRMNFGRKSCIYCSIDTHYTINNILTVLTKSSNLSGLQIDWCNFYVL